jgi:hypothetical protein
MSTAILDQPSWSRLRPSPAVQPGRRPVTRSPLARQLGRVPVPPRALTKNQRSTGGRGVVPPYSNRAVRACRVSKVQSSASWRLTDRGIALVLVLTAVLVLAAVTVIGLTAWRVTGPGYQVAGASQLSSR